MPKPVLQAMVLADHVYRDANTGKFIIAGTFGTLWRGTVTSQPIEQQPQGERSRLVFREAIVQAGTPYLYFALVEVHGQTRLELKLIDLSDAAVKWSATFDVNASDPVAVAEYSLPMMPIPTEKVATYSLDLMYEDEILGSWRIAVKQIPPPDSQET